MALSVFSVKILKLVKTKLIVSINSLCLKGGESAFREFLKPLYRSKAIPPFLGVAWSLHGSVYHNPHRGCKALNPIPQRQEWRLGQGLHKVLQTVGGRTGMSKGMMAITD